jgi:thiamine-phosphate pyrophosphorylase
MRAVLVLAALADRLNREAGRPPIPSLYFFTDPLRTPDPARIAAKLPRGAAVVYRHFGAQDRHAVARRLARICRARRLKLFIAADPKLAQNVSAAGVHWPERLATADGGRGLKSMAAHSGRALAHAAGHADLAILAPIFPSRSPSAERPLGPLRAGRLARTARLPVIALGGVNTRTAKRLLGRGFAGLAAVDGLSGGLVPPPIPG